jgi:hypothetical protein
MQEELLLDQIPTPDLKFAGTVCFFMAKTIGLLLLVLFSLSILLCACGFRGPLSLSLELQLELQLVCTFH